MQPRRYLVRFELEGGICRSSWSSKYYNKRKEINDKKKTENDQDHRIVGEKTISDVRSIRYRRSKRPADDREE